MLLVTTVASDFSMISLKQLHMALLCLDHFEEIQYYQNAIIIVHFSINMIRSMDWKCTYKWVLINVSYPHYGIYAK